MKKVLLASTAVIAFAGVASAQVAVSGSAEMGVSNIADNDLNYNSVTGAIGRTVGDTGTAFHQSADVRFTMAGETDGGLSFGALIDLEDALDEAIGNSDTIDTRGNNPDFTVFISGDFGTLTMGDTDGAFDFAMQEVNLGGGSIDDSETAHAGFNGNAGLDGFYNGQVLRYQYGISDFTIALSVETETGSDDAVYGIGATYNYGFGGGSVVIGAGYQMTQGSTTLLSIDDTNAAGNDLTVTADEAMIIGVSARVVLDSGFSAGVNYSRLEYDNLFLDDGAGVAIPAGGVDAGSHTREHFSIGAAYTFDAITVSANYGEFSASGAADTFFNNTGFGLDAQYDLGGGLRARVGYGQSDFEVGGTVDTFSLGLSMSF